MNNELIRLAEAAMHPLGCVTIHEELELLHQFRHACNPAEILALFAEIDRLKDDLQITNHACFLSIAENKRLKHELDTMTASAESIRDEWRKDQAENKSLQGQLSSALDANARLSEYPAPLRAFANELISASYEGGSFDGCDIQDIAVRHGLLRIERRESECGEVCPCREYGFPVDCYRRTSLLGPAYAQSNDAATQNADIENVSRHEGGQT